MAFTRSSGGARLGRQRRHLVRRYGHDAKRRAAAVAAGHVAERQRHQLQHRHAPADVHLARLQGEERDPDEVRLVGGARRARPSPSASLHLAMVQSDATADATYSVSVHKVLGRNPVIARATGQTADGVLTWTANACCYNNVPLAQADISPAYDVRAIGKAPGPTAWNVTALVREWLADPASNFGLLLNADTSKPQDRYRYFASRNMADEFAPVPARHPCPMTRRRPSPAPRPPPSPHRAPRSHGPPTSRATRRSTTVRPPRMAARAARRHLRHLAYRDPERAFGRDRYHARSTRATRQAIWRRRPTSRSRRATARPDRVRHRAGGRSDGVGHGRDGRRERQRRRERRAVQGGRDEPRRRGHAAPYSVSWNTATLANGSHTLTAVARDAAGNQKTSAGVTVTVSNAAPPPRVGYRRALPGRCGHREPPGRGLRRTLRAGDARETSSRRWTDIRNGSVDVVRRRRAARQPRRALAQHPVDGRRQRRRTPLQAD